MPVFFIVSGMLVGYKKITLLYVMKKMKFLIPLYVLGFFYNYYSTGLINFDWFFLAGTGKYWFFMAMVHCFIIYGITFFLLSMCKHKRAEIFVIIFSVVFALSVKSLHVYGGGYSSIIGLKMISNYLYFVTGVCLIRYKILEKLHNPIISILFLVIYVGIEISGLDLLNPLRKLSSGLFILSVFLYYKRNLLNNKIVSEVGKQTMAIYGFHYFFIFGLQLPDCIINTACLYVPTSIIIAIFVIALCILLSKIINSNKYLKFIILGQ